MKRKILIATIVALTISYLLCSFTVVYANDTETVTVSVSGASISQNGGGISISLSGDRTVCGGSVIVEFDTVLLQYLAATTSQNMTFADRVQDDGTVKLSFASAEALSNGTLLQLTFRAKGIGTSTVRIKDLILYDENGERVAATAEEATSVTYFEASQYTLSASYLTMTAGDTAALSLQAFPEGAINQSPVTWSSNDNSVATVSEEGIVTAVATGSTTIVCRVGDRAILRCTVSVTDKAVLRVDSLSALTGDEVVVKLTADRSQARLSAGSFNIIYDNTLLTLIETRKGTLLSSCSSTVNEAYADGTVRVNFASSIPLEAEADVLELHFKVIGESGYASVKAESMVMYDANHDRVEYAAQNGGVRVLTDSTVYISGTPNAEPLTDTGVSMDPYKNFHLSVDMNLEYALSSGSFDVTFDSEAFELVSATAGSALDGALVTINPKSEEGRVRVSFASSADILGTGTLLDLTMRPKTATFEETLSITNSKFYDTETAAMNVLLESLTVVNGLHEHEHIATVTDPTCTEEGYTTHTCACGDTYEDSRTDPLGHDIATHAAQAPTCTEIGWEAYEACSRCDHTTYKKLPATGHTETVDPAVEPTCTETGLTEGKHCSVCETVLEAQEEIPATGHTPGEWVMVTPPAVGVAGKEQSGCTVCGEVLEERTVPASESDTEPDTTSGLSDETESEAITDGSPGCLSALSLSSAAVWLVLLGACALGLKKRKHS